MKRDVAIINNLLENPNRISCEFAGKALIKSNTQKNKSDRLGVIHKYQSGYKVLNFINRSILSTEWHIRWTNHVRVITTTDSIPQPQTS